ncbi:50S ribosomal protein L7/L12 [Planctomycetes bacterium MalM25]|nr:50S ribosomal protein L7/L12 [Planctomycetes bacterium MalM25]
MNRTHKACAKLHAAKSLFACLAATALLLPTTAARAGFILEVDPSAKEFSLTGSSDGKSPSDHATWFGGGPSLGIYMDNFGGSKLSVVKAVKSITGLGLKESKGLVDNAPGFITINSTAKNVSSHLSILRNVGATVRPLLSSKKTSTFSFTGTDGAALTLSLAEDGLTLDRSLSVAALLAASAGSTATSYASATPAQQAFLESQIDASLRLVDGSGFQALQVVSAVPEPGSLTACAVLSGVGMLAGRRRRLR